MRQAKCQALSVSEAQFAAWKSNVLILVDLHGDIMAIEDAAFSLVN